VTPADVVTGKLLVVVAFAAVLLGATVPAAAWCVLMGGVGPSDVIHVFTYLFAVAVAVSALGVLLSARFQRSLGATVATYAVLLGLGVLSVLVIYAVSMVTMISRHASSPPAMGSAAALGLIAVPVLVTAWLLLLAVRWFLGRLPLLSRLRGSKVMAVIVFLAAAGLVAWQASELVAKTSHATPTVLILVNPYAGIGAILEEEWARGIISSSTPPGSTTPATDLTSYVWSVMVLNTAVFALAFWALAVRQVRRKSAWGPPTAAHSNED